MNTNPSAHWSAYWAQGRVTSLPDDFAANYDGEIAAFWTEQFATVPEGGRMLDLCTGNGAIALLAADHFQEVGRTVEVTAVDAAGISPDTVTARHPGLAPLVERVHFLGEAPVETLELPAASFDLVTSQYGVEYCEWAPAAAQAARLLRPGGRLAIVCHAASSDIVKTMEAEAREYLRLGKLGLVPGIRRFLSGTLSYARFRRLLQGVRAALIPEYRVSRSPLYAFVLQMIDSVLGMTQQKLRNHRLQLAGFVRQFELGGARLADMLRVNRAIHEEPEWYRVFEAEGLVLIGEQEILYQGQHRSGHAYWFEKPR